MYMYSVYIWSRSPYGEHIRKTLSTCTSIILHTCLPSDPCHWSTFEVYFSLHSVTEFTCTYTQGPTVYAQLQTAGQTVSKWDCSLPKTECRVPWVVFPVVGSGSWFALRHAACTCTWWLHSGSVRPAACTWWLHSGNIFTQNGNFSKTASLGS